MKGKYSVFDLEKKFDLLKEEWVYVCNNNST
jgi:hypothetical protein